MILECPRCGFAQPKDRYCANCGIDMERFQKAPQPKIQKILKSSIFQLSLIFLAVSAIIFFIYSNQKKNLQQNVGNIVSQDSQNQTNKQTETGKELNTNKDLSTKSTSSSGEANDINAEPMTNTESSLEKLKNLKTSSGTEENGLKSAHESGLFEAGVPISLQIQFAEIPVNAINRIKESGNSIGSSSNIIAYRFQPEKGVKSFFNNSSDLHLFPTYSKTNQIGEDDISLIIDLKPAPPSESAGAEVASLENQGLTLNFRPEIGKDAVTVSLEGSLRAVNPTDGSEITQIFEASSLTLKQGQILILNEFIPQLPFNSENQSESSPLSVLFGQDFKANNSDLVLFLNLKK